MIYLWHDDIRLPPGDNWDWARTNEEAKALLLANKYEGASLDHDLGLQSHDPHAPNADRLVSKRAKLEPNGEELAKWMAENPNVIPPVVRIHSYNPIGARRMADHLRPFTTVAIEPFDPRWRDDSQVAPSWRADSDA